MSNIDFFVFSSILITIAVYGAVKNRQNKNLKSYILGDKSVKWSTIGLSVMATQASAITFLSTPGQGFKEGMKNGPLAGFEIDSMKVTLKDGSFHPVDSDSLSFELAAKIGFKAAAKQAKAVIMEPIMKLEVLTPEENMGDIVGDLNRRRGQVNSMDDRAGSKVVKAEVPLSEMFGYVTSLRTLSSGRATSTMEFSHYAETPSNISDSVISEIQGKNNE